MPYGGDYPSVKKDPGVKAKHQASLKAAAAKRTYNTDNVYGNPGGSKYKPVPAKPKKPKAPDNRSRPSADVSHVHGGGDNSRGRGSSSGSSGGGGGAFGTSGGGQHRPGSRKSTGGAFATSSGGQNRPASKPKDKGKKLPTTYRFGEFERYTAKDKADRRGRPEHNMSEKISQKSGVLKDIHDLKKIKGAAARRTFRENKGLHLGKYYGPDQFKGDKKLNTAWEKAGRPDVNSFLRNNRKGTGNRSLG